MPSAQTIQNFEKELLIEKDALRALIYTLNTRLSHLLKNKGESSNYTIFKEIIDSAQTTLFEVDRINIEHTAINLMAMIRVVNAVKSVLEKPIKKGCAKPCLDAAAYFPVAHPINRSLSTLYALFVTLLGFVEQNKFGLARYAEKQQQYSQTQWSLASPDNDLKKNLGLFKTLVKKVKGEPKTIAATLQEMNEASNQNDDNLANDHSDNLSNH